MLSSDNGIARTDAHRRGGRAAIVALGLVAAGAAVIGGVIGGVSAATADDRAANDGGAVASVQDTRTSGTQEARAQRSGKAEPRAQAAEPSADGLAGKLAAALQGRGEVTDAQNWFPWGEKAMGQAVLADGAFGFGGSVELDGDQVYVIVHANEDDRATYPCGARAAENGVDGGCTAVEGGYVLTAEGTGATGSNKDGASATYYTEDVVVRAVVVQDRSSADAFDLDELVELAVDPQFHTAPFN